VPDITLPDITLPDTEEINLNQSLQRLLAVIARRRWWVLLPAAGAVFATFIALSFLPQKYSSEALLLVVQQQVPQRYVLPTTTTDIREALQATTQEVLSRTRLLGIIDEFSLYPKEKKRLSPEALLNGSATILTSSHLRVIRCKGPMMSILLRSRSWQTTHN